MNRLYSYIIKNLQKHGVDDESKSAIQYSQFLESKIFTLAKSDDDYKALTKKSLEMLFDIDNEKVITNFNIRSIVNSLSKK